MGLFLYFSGFSWWFFVFWCFFFFYMWFSYGFALQSKWLVFYSSGLTRWQIQERELPNHRKVVVGGRKQLFGRWLCVLLRWSSCLLASLFWDCPGKLDWNFQTGGFLKDGLFKWIFSGPLHGGPSQQIVCSGASNSSHKAPNICVCWRILKPPNHHTKQRLVSKIIPNKKLKRIFFPFIATSRCEGEDSVSDYVQERNLLHLERTSWLKYFKELTTLVHEYGRPPNMIDDFDDTNRVHVRSFYAWQYLHALVGRGDFSDERKEEVEERTKKLPKKRSFDPHTRKRCEHQYEQDMAEIVELLRENVIRAGTNVKLLTFDQFLDELYTCKTKTKLT